MAVAVSNVAPARCRSIAGAAASRRRRRGATLGRGPDDASPRAARRIPSSTTAAACRPRMAPGGKRHRHVRRLARRARSRCRDERRDDGTASKCARRSPTSTSLSASSRPTPARAGTRRLLSDSLWNCDVVAIRCRFGESARRQKKSAAPADGRNCGLQTADCELPRQSCCGSTTLIVCGSPGRT